MYTDFISYFLVMSLLSFYPAKTQGQSRSCLFKADTKKNLHKDYLNAKNGQIFAIPVVIHLVGRAEREMISDVQIHFQISALNRDFRRKGMEWRSLPTAFLNLAADARIEFCLVTIAPGGMNTSGINRKITTVPNIGLTESIYYSDQGGQNAWDPEKYLNIWVCELPENVLGFASGPNIAGTDKDGVVINRRYFATSNAKRSFQLGRTLVHEIGHYLGLDHPWGQLTDECEEDDGIADTPLQKGPHLACPPINLQSCEEKVSYWNFMDFTPDCCMALFTEQQVQVMRNTILEHRSGLHRNLCSFEQLPTSQNFKVVPNPAMDVTTISWEMDDVLLKRINVFSTQGKLLTSIRDIDRQSQIELCLSELPAGMLILNLQFSNGSQNNIKLLHVY